MYYTSYTSNLAMGCVVPSSSQIVRGLGPLLQQQRTQFYGVLLEMWSWIIDHMATGNKIMSM